jgi:hypothetical protein
LASSEDARRLEERAAFLADIAEGLVKPSILSGDLIVLRLARIPYVARAYFILNESYKAWRIEDNHYTEHPKIAALTSMAIMTILPFRPMHPENVKTVGEARCNEIYALNCAAAILGVPIDPEGNVKQDFWLRLMDILNDTRSHTLDPFVFEVNNGKERPIAAYTHQIHAEDRLALNSLISIFEILCDKHKK